jgi:peptide/nickel transport system substrate-binding protein
MRFSFPLLAAVGLLVLGATAYADTPAAVTPASDPSKVPALAKKRKDTVVAAISLPGGVFTPYFAQNGWDGNVTAVLFENLINVDSNGKPIPGLAESWKISADNLVYTFQLRKGLKFSDGTPLTSADVAFTWTLLLDPAYPGEDVDLSLASIKGGEEYKKGTASSVSGIKVIDAQTVQVTTTAVGATTLNLLGGPVLSKAYYGKGYAQGKLDYLSALHAKPVGTGPYNLDQYITGQEIRFNANPFFYKGKPQVEHFIYKVTTADTALPLFQTGETDYDGFPAKPESFEIVKKLGFATIYSQPIPDFGLIDINLKKPWAQDVRVRQALIYGLDRQKIVDAFYQGYGQVATVPTPTTSWAYTTDGVNPYAYDLAKAKSLLDAAGWVPGADGIRAKDGVRLSLTYLGSKSRAIHEVLIAVASENYKALGVEFNAELTDSNALFSRIKQGKYDLAYYRTSQIVDPDDGVNSWGPTSLNTIGYSEPAYDKAYAKTIASLDQAKRKGAYKELFQAFADKPPVILLDYRRGLAGVSARVQGLAYDPYNGIIASVRNLKIVP